MNIRPRVSLRPLGRIYIFLLMAVSAISVKAADKVDRTEEVDSAVMLLPDVEVRGESHKLFIQDDKGALMLNMNAIRGRGRTFGEADPLNEIKSLQGISSGSEYSSGFSVDGTDPTQTQYTIDGIPIIFPFRFGGIFSAFNSSHFSGLKFSHLSPSGLAPHLGGAIEFHTDYRNRQGIEGIVNIGIISSSATIRGNLRDKYALSISGRTSYIDQIYGPLLNASSHSINFSFADLNGGFSVKLTPADILRLTLMFSTDKVGYDEKRYGMDTRLNWSNLIGGITWRHSGRINISTDVYYSGFRNKLKLRMTQFTLSAPNSLETGGIYLSFGSKTKKYLIREWQAGVRTDFSNAVPQWAFLEMSELISGTEERHSIKINQNLFTGKIFANVDLRLIKQILNLNLGLSAGIYRSSIKNSNPWIKPLFTLEGQLKWNSIIGETTFSTGRLQQPLHQVGFSEIGLASDFTMGSCERIPIQSSVPFSLSWAKTIIPLGLRIGVSSYYTLVWNQSEYEGQVIEIVDESYDPFSRLIISDGYNVGAGITVERNFGHLTGQISYGYGTGSRHKRDNSEDKWRAIHSSGHSLKINLSYFLGNHWEFTGRYLFASGRPYTPVEALYMMTDNVAMEYGKRNSARLPVYSRLDIGATYRFRSSHNLTHLVNLSLLNALGNKNVELQYFILEQKQGNYKMKREYSLYRFIPSLSYTLEF